MTVLVPTKGASNSMILEDVTTCAFLHNLSAKHQQAVENFMKRLLVISYNILYFSPSNVGSIYDK